MAHSSSERTVARLRMPPRSVFVTLGPDTQLPFTDDDSSGVEVQASHQASRIPLGKIAEKSDKSASGK